MTQLPSRCSWMPFSWRMGCLRRVLMCSSCRASSIESEAWASCMRGRRLMVQRQTVWDDME